MLPGQKQNAWKLPAVINLTLGGMGAGYYLLCLLVIFPPLANPGEMMLQTTIYKLLGPLLVSLGLLALTTEAGHPLKSIYLLANLKHSWMSREALAGGIFISASVLEWLFPSPILQVVAALSGLFFILAQGMIVWRASGVFTWSVPVVPWFFLTCGLVTGCGVLLVVNALTKYNTSLPLTWVALILAVANLVTWVIFINTRGDTFRRAIAQLRKPVNLALTIGIGHILPIIILLIPAPTQPAFLIVAGILFVFGGILQKFTFSFEGSRMRSVIQP